MECVICMELVTGDTFVSPCGHEFHQACIQQWLIRNTCPVCRTVIDESREVSLVSNPNPEGDFETAEDIQREMYQDVLLPEIEEYVGGDGHQDDRLPHNPPRLVRTFEFEIGQCCVCMRNIEIFRALNCNVCRSSYYCSEECRDRATLRHHVCQMEDDFIPLSQNAQTNP